MVSCMLGIIVAELEELNCVLAELENKTEEIYHNKTFYIGSIRNKSVVVVRSDVGKVNSALTCQMLIDKYNVYMVINIGVSGSVDNKLDIGDIVVGEKLVQHDFDVTGFGRKLGEIENVGEYIETNKNLLNIFKNKNVILGTIASGDKFVTDINDKNFIRETFNALCVEMEGASVAQVCLLNNIDFLVIRSISDKLDGSSKIEFPKFLESSSKKAVELLVSVIGDL